jgi:hypothetical protein
MQYCDLCTGLTIWKLFPPNVYRHAETLAALEDSSQSCSLCMMLHRCIASAGEDYSEYNPQPIMKQSSPPLLVCTTSHQQHHEATKDGEVYDEDEPHKMDRTCIESSDQDQASTEDKFSIKLQIIEETPRCNSTTNLNGFMHIGVWTQPKRMLTSLTLMVQEGKHEHSFRTGFQTTYCHIGDELGHRAITIMDCDKYISGRVLTSEHPSEAYFGVIQRWFEDCGRTHSYCGDHSLLAPKLPDRVIDVALAGGNPCLIDGSGLVSRYATLSHCWGGATPTMTLTSNIEQKMAGIPLADLPKTFREAVIICRVLAIPYLWIDSICIIQDSPTDWQIQSSKMHSIYHDSAITLAALDAANSSQGLFLPKRPFIDVFPLPKTFGDGRGQAYLGLPSWDEFTHSPGPVLEEFDWFAQQINNMFSGTAYIRSGLLESRAWAMQELRLSQRVLYFFKGEVLWRCVGSIWKQNGCSQSLNSKHHLKIALNTYEKIFNLAREKINKGVDWHNLPVHGQKSALSGDGADERGGDSKRKTHDSNQDDDKIDESANEGASRVNSAAHGMRASTEGVYSFESDALEVAGSYIYDHRRYEMHAGAWTASPKQVFDFILLKTKGYSIQDNWYSIISDYSKCRLTFAEDKLPALSGIASRCQQITQDEYLAGHWRINLVQSLFWKVGAQASRVKTYRAPTWSWASIDGPIITPQLFPTDDNDQEDIRILDARVAIDGKNPFGRIRFGQLTVQASTMEVYWSPERQGWLSPSRPYGNGWKIRNELAVLDRDGDIFGDWACDDQQYGMLPGPPLTAGTDEADIKPRLVSGWIENVDLASKDDEAARDLGSIWSMVSYIPEHLLLIKGPTVRGEHNPERGLISILVLKLARGGGDVYERVGIGALRSWDEKAATIQTLKII